MRAKKKILIIDDEKNFADVLGKEVKRMGYEVAVSHDPEEALELTKELAYDAVLLDIRMPGISGLDCLTVLRSLKPCPEVIMLTGHATVETAIEAMKQGAYDYLTKPCKLEELEVVLQKAIEKSEAIEERDSLRSYLSRTPLEERMIAVSKPMLDLRAQIEKVALADDVPVLITGESGTGKEIVARSIHEMGPNSTAPFVALNCAVLQSSVLESELFGHEKGAFTGAYDRKLGLFEIARSGTLFLDEIGELAEEVQAKLLRAIQFGEFRRVGGTDSIQVDLRVIAATNRDLPDAISEGKFREDLYYRLNVVQLKVAPLRSRADDVESLVCLFLDRYGKGVQYKLEKGALELLRQHSWPGNVRELENFVRRLLIFQDNQEVNKAEVEACLERQKNSSVPKSSTSLLLSEVEKEHIYYVLECSNGNKKEAASKLGIATKTLYNKLNSYAEEQ